MTYIPAELRRLVSERAEGRCEYCLIHDDDVFLPHEVDHIVAEKHGGETVEANLCLSCFDCNRHKGSDLASIDPASGEIAPLFHPRRDRWRDHFRLEGDHVTGITATGRTTVRLLQMNIRERVLERRALIELGHYAISSSRPDTEE
jgi:hypothetical protein